VEVGERSYASGSDGRVVLDAPAPGRPVRIETHGYLPRETSLPRATDEELTLWPVSGTYSELYVRSLLYKRSDTTRRENDPDDHALQRVVVSHVSIVLSPEIRADAAAVAAHREAVASINDATGGAVVFSLDLRPSSEVSFYAEIDPDSRDGAFTHRRVEDDVVVGGRILYSQREGFAPARDVRYVAHELGHVLGLEHSIEPADMMYYTVLPSSPATFTELERLTIRLLLQRPPGNRYPDRDITFH
jgi:hypothetical protein